jgi:uncharacterized protein (DUF1330 family)
MPGYIVANIRVTDPDGFQTYREQVAPSIARGGGRYLVRGGEFDVKEGAWHPARLVILEFPTLAAARDWYDSPDYAPIRAIRERTAVTEVVIVDGLAGT